ncbi:MAG TPA: hypothetical protein VE643_09615 [Nitrososphaeraceae archaeon]|nr:hypothetical protein [Nitrososphaeraceae archaeon]
MVNHILRYYCVDQCGSELFSKISIRGLHKYNPKVLPDTKHGEPYHAKWIDGITPIALSTMTMFSNTPVSVTNSPIM